jgi:hypothetical protein
VKLVDGFLTVGCQILRVLFHLTNSLGLLDLLLDTLMNILSGLLNFIQFGHYFLEVLLFSFEVGLYAALSLALELSLRLGASRIVSSKALVERFVIHLIDFGLVEIRKQSQLRIVGFYAVKFRL